MIFKETVESKRVLFGNGGNPISISKEREKERGEERERETKEKTVTERRKRKANCYILPHLEIEYH